MRGEDFGSANVQAALRQWLAEHPAKRLAAALDVDLSTVTRWKHGVSVPQPRHQEALAAFLCLPGDWRERDYAGAPLIHEARVRELQRRLSLINPETLTPLYPALLRLLGQPEAEIGGPARR